MRASKCGRVVRRAGDDAQIAARNVESGVQRGTTTRSDGSYILAGLVPGTYDLTLRRLVAEVDDAVKVKEQELMAV